MTSYPETPDNCVVPRQNEPHHHRRDQQPTHGQPCQHQEQSQLTLPLAFLTAGDNRVNVIVSGHGVLLLVVWVSYPAQPERLPQIHG